MIRKKRIKNKFIGILCFVMLFISASGAAQNIIEVVPVEGGSFVMGNDSARYADEKPAHKVTLPSFYISQYEVSFDDYLAFTKVAGYPEPYGTKGMPVTNISWQKAVLFCNWLSTREYLDHAYKIKRDDKKGIFEVSCDFSSNGYRLPTEAEWEYAARGGNKSKSYKYAGSNSPYKVAWFAENSKGADKKSGTLLPNEIGVYDMSGNVAELCWDYYASDYYKNSPEFHPKGSETQYDRVYRGGSRRSKPEYLEVSRRFRIPERDTDMNVGMRVVRTKTD